MIDPDGNQGSQPTPAGEVPAPPVARPAPFIHVAIPVIEYGAGPPSGLPVYPMLDQSAGRAAIDLIAVIGLLVAFGVVSIIADLHGLIADAVPELGELGSVFANGVVALAGIGAVLALRSQAWRDIGLRSRPPRVWVLTTLVAIPACFATGIACNVIFTTIRALMGVAIEDQMRDRMQFISAISEIKMAWVFPVAIFVGIYEEILFRGFILTRLTALTRLPLAGVLLSSLLFGAVHFTQGPMGMFQTACLGLVLSLAAVRAQSLWPAILAHMAIDTISLVLAVWIRPELNQFLHDLTTTTAAAGG